MYGDILVFLQYWNIQAEVLFSLEKV